MTSEANRKNRETVVYGFRRQFSFEVERKCLLPVAAVQFQIINFHLPDRDSTQKTK